MLHVPFHQYCYCYYCCDCHHLNLDKKAFDAGISLEIREGLSSPSREADISSFRELLSVSEAVLSREDKEPELSCGGFSSVGLRK